MEYKRYLDAKEFYNAVFHLLLKHEAQNSLPLGIAVLGNNGGGERGWKNVKNWYMATVSKGGEIVLVAIMTPPFKMTLYEKDNVPDDGALNCLCENIIKENLSVSGVTSKTDLAKRFADEYTKRAGINYAAEKNMRVYTLEKVNGNIPQTGMLRRATQKDLFFLPYWYKGFYTDCGLEGGSFEEIFLSAEEAAESNMLFLLEEDGVPLSMAAATREIINGRRVAMVYTPPYFREKGYASSCVAKVSQTLLNMGYKYAALFTDLSNPVSNSIYQKIGYKPVCDYDELKFYSK